MHAQLKQAFSLAAIFFGTFANQFRARRAQRAAGRRRALFEPLERRILLSADPLGAAESLAEPTPFEFDAALNATADNYTLRFNAGSGDLEVLDGATVVASKALANTSAVVINGEHGQDDTLTVDLEGLVAVSSGITFNGGADGFDTLIVQGGDAATVTHTITDTGPGLSGSLAYDSGAGPALTIAYTDIEPLVMSGTAGNVIFNLGGADDQAILEDAAAAGFSQLRSLNGTFETTSFASSALTSLTINLGDGDDSLTVSSLPDFAGALTINGDSGDDTAAFTDGNAFGSLRVQVSGELHLAGDYSTAQPGEYGRMDLQASKIRLLGDTTLRTSGDMTLNSPVEGPYALTLEQTSEFVGSLGLFAPLGGDPFDPAAEALAALTIRSPSANLGLPYITVSGNLEIFVAGAPLDVASFQRISVGGTTRVVAGIGIFLDGPNRFVGEVTLEGIDVRVRQGDVDTPLLLAPLVARTLRVEADGELHLAGDYDTGAFAGEYGRMDLRASKIRLLGDTTLRTSGDMTLNSPVEGPYALTLEQTSEFVGSLGLFAPLGGDPFDPAAEALAALTIRSPSANLGLPYITVSGNLEIFVAGAPLDVASFQRISVGGTTRVVAGIGIFLDGPNRFVGEVTLEGIDVRVRQGDVDTPLLLAPLVARTLRVEADGELHLAGDHDTGAFAGEYGRMDLQASKIRLLGDTTLRTSGDMTLNSPVEGPYALTLEQTSEFVGSLGLFAPLGGDPFDPAAEALAALTIRSPSANLGLPYITVSGNLEIFVAGAPLDVASFQRISVGGTTRVVAGIGIFLDGPNRFVGEVTLEGIDVRVRQGDVDTPLLLAPLVARTLRVEADGELHLAGDYDTGAFAGEYGRMDLRASKIRLLGDTTLRTSGDMTLNSPVEGPYALTLEQTSEFVGGLGLFGDLGDASDPGEALAALAIHSPNSSLSLPNITVSGNVGIGAEGITNGGALVAGGGLLINAGGGMLTNQGSISGSGTLSGAAVVNAGILRPGRDGASGTLAIVGDAELAASGTLEIELQGTGAFDVVTIDGDAQIGGALDVELIGGFAPTPGDRFRFMTFDSRSGSFGTTDLPAEFVVDQSDATDLELVFAPNEAPTVDAGADQVVGLQDVDDDCDDHRHGHGHHHDRPEADVSVMAVFDDLDAGDTHTATIDWGDGTVTTGRVVEPTATADGGVKGKHTYTRAGAYAVTVTVDDGHGGVTTDTLTVTVKKPIEKKNFDAKKDEYKLNEDSVLTVNAANGVLDNDRGPLGATLRARVVEGPEHGRLTFNADGSFTYVPDRNFHGKDSFWYEFTDGFNVSRAVEVKLNVKDDRDRRSHRPIDWDDCWRSNWHDDFRPFGKRWH